MQTVTIHLPPKSVIEPTPPAPPAKVQIQFPAPTDDRIIIITL